MKNVNYKDMIDYEKMCTKFEKQKIRKRKLPKEVKALYISTFFCAFCSLFWFYITLSTQNIVYCIIFCGHIVIFVYTLKVLCLYKKFFFKLDKVFNKNIRKCGNKVVNKVFGLNDKK